MGVPIFDTTLIVVSRLRRKKPFYRAGKDHTYHRLVKLGLDPNRATLTMQFTAGFLGCLAFITLSLPPLAANIVFFACLIGGFLVSLTWIARGCGRTNYFHRAIEIFWARK